MIKFFTYQFEMGKYTSYRLLSEKGIFASFKKIEYQGFKILYSTSEFIHYQIDSQIIRKLKLKKIDNNLKNGSVEERLFQLLEGSEEKEEKEFKDYGSYWTFYNYNRNDVDLVSNINNNLLEKRWRNKYCANKYKNKK
jgi:hypothetical protein